MKSPRFVGSNEVTATTENGRTATLVGLITWAQSAGHRRELR
jgi:hypothetical protein